VYIRVDSTFDQKLWARALRRASRGGLLRLVIVGGVLFALGLLFSTDSFSDGFPLIVMGVMIGGVVPLLAYAQAGARTTAVSRQPTTYEFTDDTVRSTNALVRTEAAWAVYTGALLGRGYVALRQGTRLFTVIQTRGLPPAQLAELETLLRFRFPTSVQGNASSPPGFEANAAVLPPQQNFTVPEGGAASYTGPAPYGSPVAGSQNAGFHPGPVVSDRTE
jgi:hypothetical protein